MRGRPALFVPPAEQSSANFRIRGIASDWNSLIVFRNSGVYAHPQGQNYATVVLRPSIYRYIMCDCAHNLRAEKREKEPFWWRRSFCDFQRVANDVCDSLIRYARCYFVTLVKCKIREESRSINVARGSVTTSKHASMLSEQKFFGNKWYLIKGFWSFIIVYTIIKIFRDFTTVIISRL